MSDSTFLSSSPEFQLRLGPSPRRYSAFPKPTLIFAVMIVAAGVSGVLGAEGTATADGGRGTGVSIRLGGGAKGCEREADFAGGAEPNFLGSDVADFGASFEEAAAGMVAGAGDNAVFFCVFI